MILSMSHQSLLFLLTVGAGFGIGLLYDAFRILRKTLPHNRLVVQLEDLLFIALATLGMFAFMLRQNDGEIRFFAILGAGLGAILYWYTLSRVVMAVVPACIRLVQKVLLAALRLWLALLRLVLTPLRLLLRLLRPPAARLRTRLAKARRARRRFTKRLRRALRRRLALLKKT